MNSRKLPYVTEMSQQTKDRLKRALEQKIYLIDQKDEILHNGTRQRIYNVFGTNMDIYQVKIGNTFSCTCPDNQRRAPLSCKHILFIIYRVLKVQELNETWAYQNALLDDELNFILDCRDQNQSQIFWRPIQTVERKHIEGQDCPICYETFTKEEEEKLGCVAYCYNSCGQNVHGDCIEKWLKVTKNSPSCPLCRSSWDLLVYKTVAEHKIQEESSEQKEQQQLINIENQETSSELISVTENQTTSEVQEQKTSSVRRKRKISKHDSRFIGLWEMGEFDTPDEKKLDEFLKEVETIQKIENCPNNNKMSFIGDLCRQNGDIYKLWYDWITKKKFCKEESKKTSARQEQSPLQPTRKKRKSSMNVAANLMIIDPTQEKMDEFLKEAKIENCPNNNKISFIIDLCQENNEIRELCCDWIRNNKFF